MFVAAAAAPSRTRFCSDAVAEQAPNRCYSVIVDAPKAGQCLERCTFTQQNRICLFLMNIARTTSTYVATQINHIVVQVAVEECGTIPRSPRAGSEDSCSKIFSRKRGWRRLKCASGGHTVHTPAATDRLLPLPSSSSRLSSSPEKTSTCWLAVPQWPTARARPMSARLRHSQTRLRCPRAVQVCSAEFNAREAVMCEFSAFIRLLVLDSFCGGRPVSSF